MTEHTPTTEDVRKRYTFHASGIRHPEYAAEFDRWLEQHDREVACAERSRLLEMHESLSKRLGYSTRYLVDALKGKVWNNG